MSYVARCEQCGVIERGDLEAVGDAAEDHEQFHDVRVERVATDGGLDGGCPECGSSAYDRDRGTVQCLDCGFEYERITDRGQDVRSEWTLVCTDCDWEDQLVADGHPRDGPPSEVEDRVRKHKGTVDWSHVVRVEGRVADEDQEIDPSLLTDGGQSVDSIDRICEECGDVVVVPTSDNDDLCVGCALTSDTNYKSVVRAMSASPGATAAASEECDRSLAPDTGSELITDGGVQRWHYKDATSARSLAGVGTQNHCRNGTRGCPGPDAGGGELPCSACFLQEGDADA